MKAEMIWISLAGLRIPLLLRSPVAAEYFRDYLLDIRKTKCPGESRSISVETRPAFLSDERLAEAISLTGSRAAYAEYAFIIEDVERCIAPVGRSFFHGAAVLYKGGVYLLAGRSGIGKSTQYRNLSELYGDEVDILNGDKPVLEFANDGRIIVHSSPWMGKERWGSAGLAVPLRCIVCLEQSDQNQIERISTVEALPTVYRQFIFKQDTSEMVNRICDYTERILSEVPVYRMSNRGDPESSKMLFEQVIGPISNSFVTGIDIQNFNSRPSPLEYSDQEKQSGVKVVEQGEGIDSDAVRLRSDILLRTVAGVPLLIAVGDAATECAAMQGLNTSAAVLVERLVRSCTEEQLVEYAAGVFETEPEQLKKDIHGFLEELREGNYLIEKKTAKSGQEVL